jgi:hypothetical protein
VDDKAVCSLLGFRSYLFATRIATQYGLLVHQELNTEPYVVSMVSSLVAWRIFLIAINVMAKLTGLLQESR